MRSTIALLLLLPALAFAAGSAANLEWTHPTQYTDGSAINPADIAETLIQWRRPGSETVVGSLHVPAPAANAVAAVACGDYTFTAQTIMKDAAASGETGRIAYSSGVKCTPNPPGDFTAH